MTEKSSGATSKSSRLKVPTKTKVLVLGGGAAGLSAVFAITSSPGWQDRFDITVLQMGWRLGGKCASSRDPNRGYRNYEHGFHILGGFYHNSLKLLRECYAEWKHPPNGRKFPESALTPHNLVHLMQMKGGRWEHQCVPFPERDGEFGDPEIALTPYEMTRAVWDWIKHASNERYEGGKTLSSTALAEIEEIDRNLPKEDPLRLSDQELAAIDRHIAAFRTQVEEAGPLLPGEGSTLVKFDYGMMLQIALLFVRGIMMDRIWMRGFDCINDLEFSDWLRKHGASDDVINSPYIQGGYDYAFGYRGGDHRNRRFAADPELSPNSFRSHERRHGRDRRHTAL